MFCDKTRVADYLSNHSVYERPHCRVNYANKNYNSPYTKEIRFLNSVIYFFCIILVKQKAKHISWVLFASMLLCPNNSQWTEWPSLPREKLLMSVSLGRYNKQCFKGSPLVPGCLSVYSMIWKMEYRRGSSNL